MIKLNGDRILYIAIEFAAKTKLLRVIPKWPVAVESVNKFGG